MTKKKSRKTLFLGSDPWAPNLHRHLAGTCQSLGYSVKEVNQPGGDRIMYYEIARRVAVSVVQHAGAMGIVLCGTGMGVSMVANSFPGISCALCENLVAAERSRVLNNANVLAMGEFLTTPYVAAEIARVFLTTEFLAGIDADLGRQIKGWHKDVRNMKSRITVPDWVKVSEEK